MRECSVMAPQSWTMRVFLFFFPLFSLRYGAASACNGARANSAVGVSHYLGSACCEYNALPPEAGARTYYFGQTMNAAHTILASQDGRLAEWIVRTVNKDYKLPRRNGCTVTKFIRVELYSCRNASVQSADIEPSLPKRTCTNLRNFRTNGPEDARLVVLEPSTFGLVSNNWVGERRAPTDGPPDSKHQFVALGVVTADGVLRLQRSRPLYKAWPVDRDGNQLFGALEKNWVPFAVASEPGEDTLHVFQRLDEPGSGASIAFAVDAATGALKRRYACPGAGSALRARLGLPAGEWDAHPISGGTNAVRINTTHFLAFGHTMRAARRDVGSPAQPFPGRVYAQFAYTFEASPPFCLAAATREFHVSVPQGTTAPLVASFHTPPQRAACCSESAVQFPMGLVAVSHASDNSGDALDEHATLQLTWGYADSATYLSVIRLDWLRQHLHPLPNRGEFDAPNSSTLLSPPTFFPP